MSSPLIRAFLEHREILMALCIALCRDRHAAEDVFQEVGVAVMQHPAAEAAAVEQPLAYLRTLIRHRAADHYRREGRRQDRPGAEPEHFAAIELAFAESAADPDEVGARIVRLRACLDRLGARARRIIDGFYRDDLPIRAIAEGIGWSENAVKVALAKARKALSSCMLRAEAREEPW